MNSTILNATMRAVVQLGQTLNVSVIDVPVPAIIDPTDVIVRINATAICGSDLHNYRQAPGSPEDPFTYGHEAIGYVTQVGDSVQFVRPGDYVVIPDNTDDGHWRSEPDYYRVPLGYGGASGGGSDAPLPGLQAEYARVPFADNSLIPVPINSSTNFTTLTDYLFISDIFSTAWQGLTWSGFESGDSVVVMGAGPVGLLAAYSAVLRGASRVYSVDQVQDRLDLAESIGAIPINFNESDPVAQILAREPNGVRRGVECVGYEAVNSSNIEDAGITLNQLLNVTAPRGGVGIVGLFNDGLFNYDVGTQFTKGIQVNGAIVLPLIDVAHELLSLISSGVAHPSFIVSSVINIEQAPEYYDRFNRHLESKVIIRI